jgi:hypothetical protein
VACFDSLNFVIGQPSPAISSLQEAKITSILYDLGINPDGSCVPLTLTEYFTYGNQKNRLVSLLKNSHKVSNKIVKSLKMNSFTSNGMKDGGDAILLQNFILEHFDVFKKYCLSKEFFIYDDMEPESVDPILWIVVWIISILMLTFFVYFIFAWGVKNGGSTLTAWSVNAVLGVLQDILFVQVVKIYIIRYLGKMKHHSNPNSIYFLSNSSHSYIISTFM